MRKWPVQVPISELIGKTFVSVESLENDYLVKFKVNDNLWYEMYHSQDCCESVTLEDVEGDLDYLVGTEILGAEEVKNDELDPIVYEGTNPMTRNAYDYGSYTWTFYKFKTIKGYVDFRWFGTSNGYYSESAEIYRVEK